MRVFFVVLFHKWNDCKWKFIREICTKSMYCVRYQNTVQFESLKFSLFQWYFCTHSINSCHIFIVFIFCLNDFRRVLFAFWWFDGIEQKNWYSDVSERKEWCSNSSTFEENVFFVLFHSMEMLNIMCLSSNCMMKIIMANEHNLDRFNYLIENIGNTNALCLFFQHLFVFLFFIVHKVIIQTKLI